MFKRVTLNTNATICNFRIDQGIIKVELPTVPLRSSLRNKSNLFLQGIWILSFVCEWKGLQWFRHRAHVGCLTSLHTKQKIRLTVAWSEGICTAVSKLCNECSCRKYEILYFQPYALHLSNIIISLSYHCIRMHGRLSANSSKIKVINSTVIIPIRWFQTVLCTYYMMTCF